MKLIRSGLEWLDRDPMRKCLSICLTGIARIRGLKIRFYYDGNFWMYEWDGFSLPHSRTFSFYKSDIYNLPVRIAHYRTETNECWFHCYKPKPGDVIIDVGAEVGTDTIVFSRAVGKSGKVIAIEAQPETFARLQSTHRANRLFNTKLINSAVAERQGEVYISSDQGIQSNFIGESGELVACDTLNALLKGIPRINLLKMNIEGAERLAIIGMSEIWDKVDYVVIACHDFVARMTGNEWFRTKALVTAHLEAQGFTVADRADDPREYVRDHLHAWRNDGPTRTSNPTDP